MTEKTYPPVIVVDDNNNEIGCENFLVARERGYYIRGSRVHVLNTKRQLLIQRRGMDVLAPGLLDCSAGGSVDCGESYDVAAKRELLEEIGVTVPTLTTLGPVWLDGNQFIHDFTVTLSHDVDIIHDPREVAEVMWMDFSTIQKIFHSSPQECAPGLARTIERGMLELL